MNNFLQRLGGWLLRHPFLWLVLWCGWLSLEYFALGDLSYLLTHDSGDQEIPVSSWLAANGDRLLHARLLPELCGVDRLSTTAWVNGYRLMVLGLPDWLAHGLFNFLQRLLGAYFLFRWVREAFRTDVLPALLAGMAYTLVHFEYGELRLMHDFNEPGLPLLLWGFFRLSLHRPWLAVLQTVALGLFLSLGMDAVGTMPFLLTGTGLVTLILRPECRSRRGFAVLVGCGVVFAAAVIAPRWMNFAAMASNLEFSHRTDWVRILYFWKFFGGLLGGRLLTLIHWWAVLPLCLLWVWPGRKRDARDAALVALLIVSVLLGSFLHALFKEFDQFVGFLGGYNFYRYDRWLPLTLLVVAAYGFQRMWDTSQEHRPAVPLLIAAGIMGLLGHHSWDVKQAHLTAVKEQGQHWRACYRNPEVKALADQVAGRPERVATAAAYHAQHPNYLMPSGLEQADGYVVMYPDHYKQYWSQVIGPLIDQDPYFEGHFNNWGSRVYLFHAQDQASEHRSPWPMQDYYRMPLLSLANVHWLVSRKPLDHPSLEAVPRVAGEAARAEWSARGAQSKIQGYLRGENPGIPLYVYRNTRAFPRWFLVGEAEWFAEEASLYAALADRDEDQLAEKVMLLGEPESEASPEPLVGEVTVDEYSLEQSRLTVTANRDTWLVHSGVWYPWWVCRVDGEPLPVQRAYGAFMAVRIPAGTHEVEWAYKPGY